MKINLNDRVKFKLTELGKRIYYHQYDEINRAVQKELIKPQKPRVDEDGYTSMQLWRFMELYGRYMSIIDPNVIEPLELICEDEPRWIPCSERLPEVSEAYIVSGKQKYEFETEWSYFVDVAVLHPTGEGYIGPWQTFGDWNEGQETYITAWMKLPEPYKGEANED